jgi:putative selenium metabolism protein SsnA
MLVLKNARLLQFLPPEASEGVDVWIEGDKVVRVGKSLAPVPAKARTLDLAGSLLGPGLVCSHNHFYSALSRGILATIKPSTDFVSILQNLWWRLDRAIDEEILYSSGLVGALEAVRAGTTAVIDHHASPGFIAGSLQVLKKAFEQVGLRGILCYEVTDRNGGSQMRAGVRENVEFARAVAEEKKSGKAVLLEAAIGAHAAFTLGEEALSLLSEAVRATGAGLHIHAAEDRYDSSASHQLYGMDIMERLESRDLLNGKTICAHGVHLTDRDTQTLNRHDGFLVHNARSNMNNGVGYAARLPAFRNVALGTDGIGSDMFEELKFAYFKHKDAGGGFWPADFLGFLHNGTVLLERYFSGNFRKVEAGSVADLVIYDYRNPTPLVGANLAGHLAFGLSSGSVRTVIIGGKLVYEDRQFPFDLDPIYQQANRAAASLWKRMEAVA